MTWPSDPRHWERHHIRNPAIGLRWKALEPTSMEEVQVFYDTIIHTVFTAADGFTCETKHHCEGTGPDSKVLKTVKYYTGFAFINVFILRVKRELEN